MGGVVDDVHRHDILDSRAGHRIRDVSLWLSTCDFVPSYLGMSWPFVSPPGSAGVFVVANSLSR